jgi:hypothetical protein
LGTGRSEPPDVGCYISRSASAAAASRSAQSGKSIAFMRVGLVGPSRTASAGTAEVVHHEKIYGVTRQARMGSIELVKTTGGNVNESPRINRQFIVY